MTRTPECRAAFRDLLTAATRSEFGLAPAHAARCGSCAAEFQGLARVAGALRIALAPTPLDELTARRIAAAAGVRRLPGRTNRASGAAWAAAACLLLGALAPSGVRPGSAAEVRAIAGDDVAVQELLTAFGLTYVPGAIDVVLERAERTLSEIEGVVEKPGANLPWSAEEDWDAPPRQPGEGAEAPRRMNSRLATVRVGRNAAPPRDARSVPPAGSKSDVAACGERT